MNKKLLAIAIAAAMSAPMAAQAEIAFGGSAGFKINTTEDADMRFSLTKMRLNGASTQNLDGGSKLTGQFEVDFDNLANGSSTSTEIKKARLVWSGTAAGTFVVAGITPSGQHGDLVGNMDVFSAGGNNFWMQGTATPSVIAWVPPVSGVKVVLAALATGTDNGEDIDVTAARVKWSGGALTVAGGMVTYPSSESRTGLNVRYAMGAVDLGVAYEATDKDGGVSGDKKTIMGLSAKMTSGANTFKVAYTTVSEGKGAHLASDSDASTDVEWNHSLSKAVSTFVTLNTFNANADANGNKNVTSVGVNMGF